jgi:hypothetical protein
MIADVSNHISEIESVIKECIKTHFEMFETSLEFRKARRSWFHPWSAECNGWIIYPKNKPEKRLICLTSDLRIKTYGKYFPVFVWDFSELLWKKFPEKEVYINGHPISIWSRAVTR